MNKLSVRIAEKIIHILTLREKKSDINLDDPQVSLVHSEIIRRKYFLKKIYLDFYHTIKKRVGTGIILELGSGCGFIKEVMRNIITSDIAGYPGIDLQCSGMRMPFKNRTVDACVMIDVFHHIDDPEMMLGELDRCLSAGGKCVMIEPANTLWGRFVYMHFHHEAFNVKGTWGFAKGGGLTTANGALPWIVFCRDKELFKKRYPSLIINKIKIHTPFRYLLSGGLTLKQLLPSALYYVILFIEWIMSPVNNYIGMFMTVEIEKKSQ